MNTSTDVQEFLDSVDKIDPKAYTKALLEAEKACWEIDPIFTLFSDELWTDVVLEDPAE